MKPNNMLRHTSTALLCFLYLLVYAQTGVAQNANIQAAGTPNINSSEPPTNIRLGANSNASGNQPAVIDTTNYPEPQTGQEKFGYLSTYEFMITLMIPLLTLIALTMQFFLLKKNINLRAEETLRVFGVTLIIFGTLFLITAGFDANQIAPGMGLFGTVAGYLLGKSNSKKEKDDAE